MSVVATVFNEYGSLPRWLRALEQQSRLPDEFVIVDGGSTDGTWELLSNWRPGSPVVLDCLPRSTISKGRNHAIQLATSDIIAITDAGTIADSRWLERLLAPFDDPTVDVVAGFFVPVASGFWTTALAATTLPRVEEVVGVEFLPSSRSVALRATWLRTGFLYPVWLDYCEDLVFDLQLKRAGARFAFEPRAIVHFEPRRGIRAFFIQYFRYARGDGKAGLFPKRHFVRYITYVALAVVLARRRPLEVVMTGLFGFAYMNKPFKRLRAHKSQSGFKVIALIALASFQRLLGDVAKMTGYPVGLVWRWRRYGGLGWRTSWLRISPRGSLWQPPPASTETPPPRASRGGESHPSEKP